MNKVTIIIPVYNSEKYIGRCIESILNQTFQDFEIQIINDGSKDKSQQIINSYKKKYPNKIIAIEQKNKGVATTRNEAIKRANGDYIAFIDNDDFIDEKYLETLIGSLDDSDNYDVVISGYRRTNSKDKVIKKMKLKDTEWSKFMILAPWAKIYKKSYLIDNEIEFLSINIGEDIFFNLQAMLISNKIKILDYVGYNWFFNDESVSNSKQKNIMNLQISNLLNSCYNILEEKNILKNNYEILEYHFIRYIFWILSFSTKKLKYKEISMAYDELFNWLEDRFIGYKKNNFVKFSRPKGEIFKVRFMVKVFMILHKIHLAKLLIYIYSKL